MRGPLRVILVAAWAAAGTPTLAQEPGALSTVVALSDFGVARAADVAWGRVAIVHAPEGPHLQVHFLTISPPRVPAEVAAPDPGAGADRPSSAAASRTPEPPLAALWVWNTAELVGDVAERADFLDFVAREGIDRVFLQLTPAAGLAAEAGYVPFDGAALGPLLAELRARGARTYALDGDPEYARPPNHEGVVRTVERVAAHNRAVPPEQRFHGVRYDVEPYLLPGFQGPRRSEILADWMRMIERVAAAARDGELAFGVDVPFWLDGLDEVTGAPFTFEEGGARVPVLGRILELVDDVGVMAYRTSATGPDGVLALGGGELARARPLGVGVFVGVETTLLPDEEFYTLRGPPRPGLPPLTDARWVVLQELEGGRARIRLVEGAGALEALRGEAAGQAEALLYWFVGAPVHVPGAWLSFQALGPEAMRRVAAEVVGALAEDAAFLGLAYHDYRGLRELLDGP